MVLLARSADVDRLAAELGAAAVRGSVEVPADLDRLVETAKSRFGRLDAVVTNTGHVAKGELLDLTDDQWRNGLDLLLLNVIRMKPFSSEPDRHVPTSARPRRSAK